MAASGSGGELSFQDMYSEKGLSVFQAWRASRPETWSQFHCPLTSLRDQNYDELRTNTKQFRLGTEWRHQCERMRHAHPSVTSLIPVFLSELLEFDVRCWFLGLPPLVGLQLRQHNFERSGIIWP